MSELVYHPPNIVDIMWDERQLKSSGVTQKSASYQVVVPKPLQDDKPVSVVDDAIEINERLLQPGIIHPIDYEGEKYFVRREGNSVEVFQLE